MREHKSRNLQVHRPAANAGTTEPLQYNRVVAESFPLPGHDCARLGKDQGLLPAGPEAGQPYPQQPICRVGMRSGP